MTTNIQISKDLQQAGFEVTPKDNGVIVSLNRYLWIDEVQIACYQFEWGQELEFTFKKVDANSVMVQVK